MTNNEKIINKLRSPEYKKLRIKDKNYDDFFISEVCNLKILKNIKKADYDFFGASKDNGKSNTLKTFTLCFDIRGSTSLMSIAKNQKTYTDFVEEIISLSQATITKYNGIYDKFTGDGGLCHFIAEENINDNAHEDCISCSLEIIHQFKDTYQHFLKKQRFKVDLKETIW